MIPRALRLLSSEVRGLQRAVYVLAGAALLSSLLALLRDRLLAHAFGASRTLDLYYAAFRIPDIIFVATGALVSVYILIPELAKRSDAQQKEYLDTIVLGFSILTLLVCILAAFAAPAMLAVLFPAFGPEGLMPTLVLLTRIMLMQPFLLGLSNILAAVTQSRMRYALYSISPLLYNLGIIIGVVALYPIFGIQGLAYGVILGAFMHMAIQLPSIFADGFFSHDMQLSEPRAFFETIFISIPRAMALSMSEIAELGLIALCGVLAPGSIAIFNFAYNLQAVPLSVIGSSYSVAAFPTLASALTRGERQEFVSHVSLAARHVVFWSLPATMLAVVLRANVVRVILGSGQFNWTDTRLTAAAFALFSLSLVAQGLTLLIVRAYYAAGRTFVPFLVSALTAVSAVTVGVLSINAFQNPFLEAFAQSLLRVGGVPGSSVLALAFAYALASIVGTLALLLHFEYRFGGFFKQVGRSWTESLVASVFGGGAAHVVLQFVGPVTLSSTLASVFVRGFEAGVAGIIVCALTYRFLGSREYIETAETLRGRMRKTFFAPSEAAVTLTTSAEDEQV